MASGDVDEAHDSKAASPPEVEDLPEPGKDTVETSKEVADDWSALTDEHPADATSSFLPASVAEWLLELRGRRPGDTLLFPEPLNLGDRVFTSASVERDFRTASGALLLRMDPGGHRYIVKFADVRQEHAMMCALMEMNRRWKEHQVSVCGRSVQTVTYEIYPIGSSGGLIEAVDGCRTLRELKRLCHPETHQRVYRALAGDASKLDTLAATTVAYLTACYALGVRDGHDDNIMLREDGSLFRVDFGFVFGAMPEIDTPQTVVARAVTLALGERWMEVVGACGDSLTALTGDSYGSPPALECLSSVPEMEPFLPLARLHTASLSLAGFCQDVSCADQWSFSRAAKNTLREAVQFLRDQAGLGPEAPTSQANNSKVLGDLAVWMAPGAEDAEPDLEAHLNFVLDSGVDLLGLYRAAPERFTADGKPLNLQDFGDLFLGPLADFAEVAREGLVIEESKAEPQKTRPFPTPKLLPRCPDGFRAHFKPAPMKPIHGRSKVGATAPHGSKVRSTHEDPRRMQKPLQPFPVDPRPLHALHSQSPGPAGGYNHHAAFPTAPFGTPPTGNIFGQPSPAVAAWTANASQAARQLGPPSRAEEVQRVQPLPADDPFARTPPLSPRESFPRLLEVISAGGPAQACAFQAASPSFAGHLPAASPPGSALLTGLGPYQSARPMSCAGRSPEPLHAGPRRAQVPESLLLPWP